MTSPDSTIRPLPDLPARLSGPFVWRWLMYFVPWAILLVLVLGIYNRSHLTEQFSVFESARSALVKNGEAAIALAIQRQISDVLVLARDDDLASYVESGSATDQTALAEDWLRVLQIKRVFDQIRLLDQSGRERLRVVYNNGQPSVVPAAQLRSRAHRPVFQEASRLDRGEIYVSPMDLNVESTEIERPDKPVIRFAVPVFDRHGQRRGVFVVNYLAADLLSRLNALASASNASLMLLNAQGYWLHGADSGDEWAFMHGRPVTLETRYPGTWAVIQGRDSGQLRDSHGLWAWASYHLNLEVSAFSRGKDSRPEQIRSLGAQSGYFWKIVSRLPNEQLEAIEWQHHKELSAALALGLFLLSLSAWRMADAKRRQDVAERELRQLNQTLEAQVSERTRRLQNEIFDRQMAERRYRESSEQYQYMVATTVEGYWLLDDHGGFLDANNAACEMLGTTRDILLGMSMTDFVVGESREVADKRIADLILKGSERFELRLRRLNGAVIDVEISASYLPDFLRFIAFVRDISERKRNEQERRLAAMVMSNADEAIFVLNAEGTVVSANPAFVKITGITPQAAFGEHADRLGLSSVDGTQSLSQLLAGQASWRAEMRGRRKSGEVYPVWFSATTVRDDEGRILNYVCVFSDITEIKESQSRLDFLAHHDALTGLPNRLLFRARLEHSLERAGRSKNQIAVMFIDLDHFKEVNDTMGHAVGDQLLIDLAAAMNDCLRAEDTLARLGGDEFVVLLEQVSGHESVDAVLEKFRQVYPWTVSQAEHRIVVTASIGVAIYPDHAADADALVMQADAAMYRAKDKGRDQAVYA